MYLRNKKTGEIESVSIDTFGVNEKDRRIGVSVLDFNSPSDYRCIASYSSLAKLNEEWEDYKPAEPLIKDEKIRKAVRAWAEAQGLTEVYLASNGYEVYGGVDDWVMQFKGEPFPFADKNRLYTIAELCGEEKE